MIYRTMSRAPLLGFWLTGFVPLVAVQPAPGAKPVSRTEAADRKVAFVKRVEAAFATRDTGAVAALADVEAWRAAGHPELSALRMFLPSAPLVFERELAPGEVIYRDGDERRWRLVLREVKGELRALVRAEPCPRGAARAPQFEREERPTSKVQTWTLLECWPLPK